MNVIPAVLTSGAALALLVLGALGGVAVRAVPARKPRAVLALLSAGLVLAAPLSLPGDMLLTRAALATSGLLVVHRLWETAARLTPNQTRTSLFEYLCYFVSVPELVFCESVAERDLARRRARQRLLRGLAALAGACLSFVALAVYPKLWDAAPTRVAWSLIAMYTFCAGLSDTFGAIGMWVTRHDALEVFDAPFLARSPRDFWGTRWNMTFRNACHRLIFRPVCTQNPTLAATLVFAWSALVHEYLVVATLGSPTYQMTAFFLLHGAATTLQSRGNQLLRARLSRSPIFPGVAHTPRLLPAPIAISLHTLWMAGTSPLFFAPIYRIVQPLDQAAALRDLLFG